MTGDKENDRKLYNEYFAQKLNICSLFKVKNTTMQDCFCRFSEESSVAYVDGVWKQYRDEVGLKSMVGRLGPASTMIDASHESFQNYAGGKRKAIFSPLRSKVHFFILVKL